MENLEYKILDSLFKEQKKLAGQRTRYAKTEFEQVLKSEIPSNEFDSSIDLLHSLKLININPSFREIIGIERNIGETYSITQTGFLLKQMLEEKNAKFNGYLKAEKELYERGDGFLIMLFFNQTEKDSYFASLSLDSILEHHFNKS